MKNIINYLKQLGFSEVESKLYLLLLKSGSITVAELAEKAKINRTATYSHINALLEKGIIAKVKGNANKIAANPPEHLHNLVEQQAIRIGALQEKLPTIISSLNASLLPTQTNLKPETKHYRGKDGVKAIYQEILKAEKIRAYFNPGDLHKVFPGNIKLCSEALSHNPKMKVFEIAEDNQEARSCIEYSRKIEERHFWKLLPPDIKLTANDILIYEGKVAIINIRDRQNITGVVLTNRDYYNNSVQLFYLLWRFLPEPVVSNRNI